MINWIKIERPEEIETCDEVLVWDGYQAHLDFADENENNGLVYMVNGTEPTHYAIINNPDGYNEFKAMQERIEELEKTLSFMQEKDT